MNGQAEYLQFLESKAQVGSPGGFEPVWLPDFLYDFQRALVGWAVRRGRAAVFADCGLGKTPIQLTWAENVVRHTGRPVLILTPLAVSHQTVREGEKFGVKARRSEDGTPRADVTVTNYERLDKFDPRDYSGVVADEASVIKHWTGATQKAVTRFLSKLQYRLLCTATPAPNDYVELGVMSEALGGLTHTDMLATFFRQLTDDEKKKRATADDIVHSRRLSWRVIQSMGQWSLRPHAFVPFWRWVASWARACRRPSDLGDFPDGVFVLPPLNRRDFSILWCQLNPEGDALEKAIPYALQVAGQHDTDYKETVIEWFLGQRCVCDDRRFAAKLESWRKTRRDAGAGAGPCKTPNGGDCACGHGSGPRRLITKAKIAGLGLNLQHCAHVVTFVTHSYEQFYQCVRRCWRFGQRRPVTLDVIATEGEVHVRRNMDRKEKLAAQMFDVVVRHMNDSLAAGAGGEAATVEVPAWLSRTSG
jgi:hypothetical protein